jgi:leader peptidase (prepilin peptidase) / N-methyltransferase
VSWSLGAALVSGAAGAGAGVFVPRLIARIPEPAPEPAPEPEPAREPEPVPETVPGPAEDAGYSRPFADPKELYVDLAARPGLRVRAAVASGVAALLIGGRVGWHPALSFLLYLVPVCVALAVVDWRTRYLPTWLIAPSYAVVGALVVLAGVLTRDWDALRSSAIGWVAAFLFFAVLWVLPGAMMAYGDVRLAGLLGMALGWFGLRDLALGLYTGFLLGAVVGLVLARLRVFHHRHTPFGPHMIIGALLGVVVPDQLGDAYGWLVTGLVDALLSLGGG